ncbi:MAG: endonuclease III [Rickettsiales bacterium]|jgi:endonuclease-3|nr:endonuclease III [Rickettsiales bacterium]
MISKSGLEKMLSFFDMTIGDRKSELEYRNPYTFATAVLLSAQATDKSVNIATKDLFEAADNPKAMRALGPERVKKYIKSIGLFNNKAKNIIAMADMLIEKFGGELPKTRDGLMSLPGIGRKSANVIMNELYGAPTIGVDTHVMRLAHRLGMAPEDADTPEKVEAILEKTIPGKFKPFISNYLVLHGRYTCTARNPKCGECGIKSLCEFRKSIPPASE